MNYDKIVNFLYEENDAITKKIIESYQEYIFSIKNNKCKKNIDKVLSEYILKENFYKYVKENFDNEVLYSTYDIVIKKISMCYKNYYDTYTIKNSRWL